MAGEEAELEIKIIPEEEANLDAAIKTEEKTVEKKAEPEIKDDATADLVAQYKDLEAREAETNRRKAETDRENARLRAETETAKKQVANSQLDTVTTALNAAKADAEQAKRDYRTAKEAGDIDAEVEANERLQRAIVDERRLDEAKSDLEARAKAPPKRQEPVRPSDPVEAFVSDRTEPTANWIRAHPEFVRTPKGLKQLTAADAVAQAEDLAPDTPEYFARVEEYLGITKGTVVEKKAPTEAAQVRPRASAPVAPGSAVANGGNGSGDRPVVSLTAREAAAAVDGTHVWNYNDPKGKFKKGDPIGHQEFARRKVAMQKQGLYDRMNTEQ